MRIKKTSQTTPIQAQVVNTQSNSTTDSYSCNYVNGIDNIVISDTEPTGTNRKKIWYAIGTKNLLNYNNLTTVAKNEGIYVENNVVIATNKTTDSRNAWTYANSNWQMTLPAGTYTLSFTLIEGSSMSSGPGCKVLNTSNTELLWVALDNRAGLTYTGTFTLSSTTQIGIMVKQYDNVYKIQLEEGTQKTNWQPYGNSIQILNETTDEYETFI